MTMLIDDNNKFGVIVIHVPTLSNSSLHDMLMGTILCDIDNNKIIQVKSCSFKENTTLTVFDKIKYIKKAIKNTTNNYYCINRASMYLIDILNKLSYAIYNRRCIHRIQAAWRLCISNPEYKICRKRLLEEFNSLNTNLD